VGSALFLALASSPKRPPAGRAILNLKFAPAKAIKPMPAIPLATSVFFSNLKTGAVFLYKIEFKTTPVQQGLRTTLYLYG